MSYKRPIILKALARPGTLFGMHSIATLSNLTASALIGFLTQILFGGVLFAVFQVWIAILTRKDRYFGEVLLKKISVGRTKNLNPLRRGNYYAV